MIHPRRLVLVLASLILFAACSTEPAAQATRFCDTWLSFQLAADPDIDFHSASEQEIEEGMRAFAAGLVPTLRQAEEDAPEPVSGDIGTLVATFEDVAADGDPGQMEEPALEEAYQRVHARAVDDCGWAQQQIEAAEYAFNGVPASVDAGITSFELENQGTEFHEMALLRKNPGVTVGAVELLELPDEEAFEQVEFTGVAFAGPGESASLVRDLEPGNYVMACFIPVGLTDFENEPPEGQSQHWEEGMYAEFSVN